MTEGTQRFTGPTSSAAHIAPGAMLDGKFEIIREIARGGMGVVYLARQIGLAREVAIKVVAPGLLADPEFMRRFRREALTLAQLRHAHVVSVHDFVQSDDASFLVLDYLPGGDLDAYFTRTRTPGKGLPIEEVARLLDQLLSGLAHAHRAGIIHRDLKPANLLLDAGHDLRIADFGLAQLRPTFAAADQSIPAELAHAEHTRTVAGTIDFMAPEVRRGALGNEQSDLYAVGVIAYWLICGERPGALCPAPSRHPSRPAIPTSWDQWMARSLADRKEARFATAQEMLAELRALRGSRAPQIRRKDLGRGRVHTRNKMLTGLVVAVAALIVTAIVIAVLSS